MRKMKRLLGVLLSILLIHTMSFPVMAAGPGTGVDTGSGTEAGTGTDTGAGTDTSNYADTYTARIFTGQQGVIVECTGGKGKVSADGRTFTLDGLSYGQRISVSQATLISAGGTVSGGDAQGSVSDSDVSGGDVPGDTADQANYFQMTIENEATKEVSRITVKTESRYNIIGTRESGKDNSERIASELIENDSDYVIAYGLMKDAVEYTINYVDTAGNPLHDSDVYMGTIGDKPVVAYRYFDGYQPQAYNLTKTLSANAAENIFTFVYTLMPAPGVTVVTIPGAPGPEGTPGEDTIVTIPGGGGAGGGGGAPAVPGPGGEDIPDEDTPQGEPPEPEERQDLDEVDDEETPRGDFDGANDIISILNGNAFLVNVPLPAKILAVAAFVVILGGGIWWIVRSRIKRKEDAEDSEGSGSSDGSGHSGKSGRSKKDTEV